jgi:hypothetical protein
VSSSKGQQDMKIVTGNDLLVDVNYNIESLKKLLINTDVVLADVSAFLKEDPANKYSMQFYIRSGFAFPEKQWKEALNKYADNPVKKEQCVKLVEDLEMKLSIFEQNVVPIWKSFLPETEHTCIKSNVYFTAFTSFDAINVHDNIVINALNPKFQTNTDYLMNALTHELFHSGYSSCSPYREEPLLEQKIYYLLETLQNEGLTTHVTMQASGLYPAPDIVEYKILEDKSQVNKMRQNLNIFFSQIDSMTSDEVLKEAWILGVQQRAFYVVGAEMAHKIEIEKGREVLAETVAKGPIYFYDLYNSIAKEDEKLYLFDFSNHLSPANELREAISTNSAADINQVRNKILASKGTISQTELEVFYRLGYRLLRGQKQLDNAEIVFKLLLDLADNPSFAYAYLGEIEIERGNVVQAKEYLSKSLELDEYNPLALKLLDSIN